MNIKVDKTGVGKLDRLNRDVVDLVEWICSQGKEGRSHAWYYIIKRYQLAGTQPPQMIHDRWLWVRRFNAVTQVDGIVSQEMQRLARERMPKIVQPGIPLKGGRLT